MLDMNKKFIIIIIVFIAVGLVGLVWLLGPRFGIEIKSLVNFESGRLSSCGKDMTLFNKAPMKLNKLTSIRPLGSLDPLAGHVFPVDYLYLFATGQEGARDKDKSGEVDVFSPGNVQLTKVAYIEYKDEDTIIDRDYSLYFKPCREVEAAFYHIKTLSPALMSETAGKFDLVREETTGQHTQNRFEVKTDIILKAGEIIGKAGGTFRAQAFDFRMADERTDPLLYARPDRWDKLQQHIVCPLDYYTEPLKGQLMKLIGTGTKPRSKPPVCGRVDQDNKGTAQGIWFAENTKKAYPEDSHMALVHDDIDPGKPVFSVGTSMQKSGLAAGLYYYDVKKSGFINRDFNEVNEVDKAYCYQGLKNKWGDKLTKVIMVELAGDNTIKIEARSRLSCVGIDPALSDRMTVFER